MHQARQLKQANRPAPRPQPDRRPGVSPQPATRLKKVKLMLILFTCFALSLAVVGQYSSLVILNYRLSSSRAELAAVTEVSRDLELEAAKLSSIGRIEQIARDELGMTEPGLGQLRVITAGRNTAN